MAPGRGSKRQSTPEGSSSKNARPKKAHKREPTYDTYDEAMDGGVEMEEKGERYGRSEKAQRFYERAVDLYRRAAAFEQKHDAVYNQARAVYKLAVSFYLAPADIERLEESIALYRVALTLEAAPLVQIDTAYNLAQALTALANTTEDRELDPPKSTIRAWREEARALLGRTLEAQVGYLRSMKEAASEAEADAAIEGIEGEEVQDKEDAESTEEMAVDPPGETATTYEDWLPTSEALVDTLSDLMEIQNDLWETADPLVVPSDGDLQAGATLLESVFPFVQENHQPYIDLAQIKMLLSSERTAWDLHHEHARPDLDAGRSGLEAAAQTLQVLLDNLQGSADSTLVVDVVSERVATLHASAERMRYLLPQVPPGPSPLGQQAWAYLSQAMKDIQSVLDTPYTPAWAASTKPSFLLEASYNSLARARLGAVNETARRNAAQLVENAVNYADKALDGLGWKGLQLGTGTSTRVEVPWQAGWNDEQLAHDALIQLLRVAFVASRTNTLEDPAARQRLGSAAEGLLGRMKTVPPERRVTRRYLQVRIRDQAEDQFVPLEEAEQAWWEEIAAKLDP